MTDDTSERTERADDQGTTRGRPAGANGTRSGGDSQTFGGVTGASQTSRGVVDD